MANAHRTAIEQLPMRFPIDRWPSRRGYTSWPQGNRIYGAVRLRPFAKRGNVLLKILEEAGSQSGSTAQTGSVRTWRSRKSSSETGMPLTVPVCEETVQWGSVVGAESPPHSLKFL